MGRSEPSMRQVSPIEGVGLWRPGEESFISAALGGLGGARVQISFVGLLA